MIKIKHDDKEQIILTVLDGMTWSGSKTEGPRSLNFEFLYKPINEDIPKYSVTVGDTVVWEEEGKVLFQGYIETLNYNTDDDTISVGCKDLMARLMRSKFIGRMKGTLNEIANNICGSFDIINGISVDAPHIHNIVSTGDKTYYDVLSIACETLFQESLHGHYHLYLDRTTLKLSEHEIQKEFKTGVNIRTSSFKQSIEKIVTKVLIIDNEGKIINTKQNDELIKKFGLFQEIYNYNKDIKDNVAEAGKLITKSITKEAHITTNNDNNCITGRFIKIIEPVNNYIGTFEILEDTHSIGADSNMTLKIALVEE